MVLQRRTTITEKIIMTGVLLKANHSGINNNIGFPIVIKSFLPNTTAEQHISVEKFIQAKSAEEQLGLIKSIVEDQKHTIIDEIIQFLAIVYYEAPAKHPIKCFLSRHVTKCTNASFQKCFTYFLTAHIQSNIERDRDKYEFKYYSEGVSKIMLCIENFNCGALALDEVPVDLLTEHLFYDYFFICRKKLRESILSPTKKNDMFNLDHIMLKLMCHIITMQKLQEEDKKFVCTLVQNIRAYIHILIIDEDVPMDTKSLSGILFLLSENLALDKTGWESLLQTTKTFSKSMDTSDFDVCYQVLNHKIGRLVVYSAIATTISMDELQEKDIFQTGTPAVLLLIEELLSYADGSASKPAVTVAVSRALLQLSRSLSNVRSDALGGRTVSALLPFVWTHLEFQLDSVKHLANQILASCIDYCAQLDKRDVGKPLESLLGSVRALGEVRSFYWAVCRAVPALGAPRVLRDLCNVPTLLDAAATQHLQAAACAAIAALLSGGACAGLDTSVIFDRWVRPALDSPPALLTILPAAIELHPALADYIASKVRGRAALACVRAAPACRACLTQRALRAAAIHKHDETRTLALSLVSECGRTTASVSREELDLVLWFLRYNLNTPRPTPRTAMLANINKLLKRLNDSHHALSRRGEPPDYYGLFIEELRVLCFAAALRGASHGRRSAALQLLAATESILPIITREWKAEYVETLLLHLEDSYDANKAHALQVLQHCPKQLLEACTREFTLTSVLASAVSLRAACGPAAAVKLRLLLTRLPAYITPMPTDIHDIQDETLRPQYALLRALLQQLCDVAQLNMWQEAARGGAAGTLRCVADVLRQHISGVDWHQAPWTEVARQLTDQSVDACIRAEPIVAHHAPEGYLPHFPTSAIEVEESRSVTAQMVLVCAWRTVKEASAVLGLLAPVLEVDVCARAGGYLVQLLMRAMHRGAVEQAAVGLEALARACWSDESRAHLPRAWIVDLLSLVGRGAPHATRRGAGLPAAIQALVSSEVSATGRAECFNECMGELLRLASSDTFDTSGESVARRTLAANILRALYRHSTLEKVSQTHVAAGLRLALQGFEAAAWPERTAMSLLFCALCVRVFGVTRARGPVLHARNTLPAKLFLQRYPTTCDLMLSKLMEFEPGSAAGPGVLPVLLLLSRLYPSAVEGAAPGLKISVFVPLVQRCACATELRIRRVAARALPAILPPSEYLPYIEKLFTAISRPKLLYNHWHGTLLTLSSLLESVVTPDGAHVTPGAGDVTPNCPQVTLESCISKSMHALTQAIGSRPCYVVAKEYVNILNLVIWKFPEALGSDTLSIISQHLKELLFCERTTGADRELCLADCTLLYFIILHKQKRFNELLPFVNRTLLHASYEVVLSTLDYLLIQHDAHTDIQICNFKRHLITIRNDTILRNRKETSEYMTMITKLSDTFQNTSKYQECRIKSLKLLTLERNTQSLIINDISSKKDDLLVKKLISKIEESHENTKHLFLESLLNFTKEKFVELDTRCLLDIHKTMYDCCSYYNSEECRTAVIGYLETDPGWRMMDLETQDSDNFRFNALVMATLVTLLEDDDDVIRQRASDVTIRLTSQHILYDCDMTSVDTPLHTLSQAVRDNAADGVIASASGDLLRDHVTNTHGPPLLVLLALLDFRAEVCLTDEITDECRVFDQSERYNIFLEESVWTAACADKIIENSKNGNLIDLALSIIRDTKYSPTFQELCKDNVILFERMAKGDLVNDDTVNPKIEILVKKLRESSCE